MGVALGGSLFWGVYGVNVTSDQRMHAAQTRSAPESIVDQKEKADEALARYTYWLTAITCRAEFDGSRAAL